MNFLNCIGFVLLFSYLSVFCEIFILLIFVFTQAMSPEVVANVSGAIQWEDSDTEEVQDSKLRQKPTSQRNANQILDIPGNEVSHLNFFSRTCF